MEMKELLIQSAILLVQSAKDYDNGAQNDATTHLCDLRKLLNDQPELEAGGPCFRK